jgi:vacuolar-type H+-ATPase subunit H
MAGLDLNKDYQSASDKIGSYQTVKKSKEDSVKQAKEKVNTSTDKRKSDVQKSLNDLKNKGNNKKNEIKNQVKNQLDQLLDLFTFLISKGTFIL